MIVGVADEVVVPVLGGTRLFVRVLVLDTVGTTTPSTASTPAAERDRVVSVACPSSTEPTPIAVLVDATRPLIGKPVAFVSVPEAGVPRTGAVRVGLVRVLLVRVSVVALPTRVSVLVGRVSVPVLDMVPIIGEVRVLLVRV